MSGSGPVSGLCHRAVAPPFAGDGVRAVARGVPGPGQLSETGDCESRMRMRAPCRQFVPDTAADTCMQHSHCSTADSTQRLQSSQSSPGREVITWSSQGRNITILPVIVYHVEQLFITVTLKCRKKEREKEITSLIIPLVLPARSNALYY